MQARVAAHLERIVEEGMFNSPIGKCKPPGMMISPVAQIAQDLSKSSLSATPTSDGSQCLDSSVEMSTGKPGDGEQGLFKNVFKIKSTPEGAAKSRLRGRRLLGMASRRLASPEVRSPLRLINKENDNAVSSPQLSTTPQKMTSASRLPLEDFDPNSQDSGYGCSTEDTHHFRFVEPLGVAPKRLPLDSPLSPSPKRLPGSPSTRRPPGSKLLLKKLSSGYSTDEDVTDFPDLLDMDTFMEPSSLPNGLSKLLSGDIIPKIDEPEKPMETDAATTPEFSRTKPILRRSISINNDRLICRTPPMSRVRSCLFRSPNATSSTSRLTFDENRTFSPTSPTPRSFKRPEPPSDSSPILVKRSKKAHLRKLEGSPMTAGRSLDAGLDGNILGEDLAFEQTSPAANLTRRLDLNTSPGLTFPRSLDCKSTPSPRNRHLLQRSFSETEAHAHIKSAIHRSTTDSHLTGDFSKTCILPLTDGHHEDLKSISEETLCSLVRGEFNDYVESYKIVDCRYPYEFKGGHIEGALNLYTKEMIELELMNLSKTPVIQPDSKKRNIIVFHCEFSWERAPNLSRYLRNIDRKLNKEFYPALHYPEIYLLHGGYKQFFELNKEFCKPQGYRPMTHPDHEADLKKFRSKSKSWQGEKNRVCGLSARANLKRLGL